MAGVIVIGGGPAGLATALLATKNGLSMTVFGANQTWVYKAHLLNYPGIGSVGSSNYMETLHTQVDHFDTERHQGEEVTDVSESDDRLVVATDDDEHEADCVMLATGIDRDLAESPGCAFDNDLVDVGVTMEMSAEDTYATGATVYAEKWQIVIPAGDGVAAALSILLREEDEHCRDFDVPIDAESVFGSLIDEV